MNISVKKTLLDHSITGEKIFDGDINWIDAIYSDAFFFPHDELSEGDAGHASRIDGSAVNIGYFSAIGMLTANYLEARTRFNFQHYAESIYTLLLQIDKAEDGLAAFLEMYDRNQITSIRLSSSSENNTKPSFFLERVLFGTDTAYQGINKTFQASDLYVYDLSCTTLDVADTASVDDLLVLDVGNNAWLSTVMNDHAKLKSFLISGTTPAVINGTTWNNGLKAIRECSSDIIDQLKTYPTSTNCPHSKLTSYVKFMDQRVDKASDIEFNSVKTQTLKTNYYQNSPTNKTDSLACGWWDKPGFLGEPDPYKVPSINSVFYRYTILNDILFLSIAPAGGDEMSIILRENPIGTLQDGAVHFDSLGDFVDEDELLFVWYQQIFVTANRYVDEELIDSVTIPAYISIKKESDESTLNISIFFMPLKDTDIYDLGDSDNYLDVSSLDFLPNEIRVPPISCQIPLVNILP